MVEVVVITSSLDFGSGDQLCNCGIPFFEKVSTGSLLSVLPLH